MSSVTAFGYSVSLTVVLFVIGLVIGLLLAVMFWLTVGLSVYRAVQDTRRQRVREELRDRILDGMFEPDPDWAAFVEDLSAIERDEAESLLDEYLRELDGENVEKLQELGEELGLVDRSRRWLESNKEHKRLYALTWLSLLDRPGAVREADFTPHSLSERAAVARLRYESGDLDAPREGIALLLEDTTGQFTVFGQDTLYRIATEDPGALLEIAAEQYETWSEALLVQVLVVCQHLGTSITDEDVSWLLATLDHDSPAVRRAAVRAFGNLRWRSDVHTNRRLVRRLDDPSPQVRAAVYRVLIRWSDTSALPGITDRLRREADARTRLEGVNALVGRHDLSADDVPPELEGLRRWSSEHMEYDRAARQRGQAVGD